MNPFRCLLPLLPLTILATSVATQDTASPAIRTELRPMALAVQPVDVFVIEAGEHKLADIVDRAAAYLGRNYLMADLANAGQSPSIKLQTARQFDAERLERTLGQLLYVNGFAVVEIDAETKLFEVIAMFGPRRGEVMNRARWVTPEEVLARRDWYEPVATTVALRHINAQMASNALRPFIAQSNSQNSAVTIGTLGDQFTLAISGFAPSVAPVIEMLRRAEEAAAAQEENARTADLQKRIEELEQRQTRGPQQAQSGR